MRIATAIGLLACAGILLAMPAPARAIPLAPVDYAAASQAKVGTVQLVRHRSVRAQAQPVSRRYKRHYDWTYYPYYRPYYYRYWQFYYPYGGPLF